MPRLPYPVQIQPIFCFTAVIWSQSVWQRQQALLPGSTGGVQPTKKTCCSESSLLRRSFCLMAIVHSLGRIYLCLLLTELILCEFLQFQPQISKAWIFCCWKYYHSKDFFITLCKIKMIYSLSQNLWLRFQPRKVVLYNRTNHQNQNSTLHLISSGVFIFCSMPIIHIKL